MKSHGSSQLTLLFTLISLMPGASAADQCDWVSAGKIGGTPTWSYGSGIAFSTPKLQVDADGAPNSYLVDGNGLSYTCDGVVAIHKGRRINSKTNPLDWQEYCRSAWEQARNTNNYSGVAIFGFLTDTRTGRPLIQQQGDPLPGVAYISTTTVKIPGIAEGQQRRYIDATQIPYVVLPSDFVSKHQVKRGALAIVYRLDTDTIALAAYGDGGDLGEASVRTHELLGNDPVVKTGGIPRAKRAINDPVVTVVFPSVETKIQADYASWLENIKATGAKQIDDLGGEATVRACLQRHLKEIDRRAKPATSRKAVLTPG